MSLSPLQFAREFERLKSSIVAGIADDVGLLELIGFWKELEPVLNKPTFASYRREYVQLIESFLSESSVEDLPIESLRQLLSIVTELELPDCDEIVRYRLAQVFCYVGEFETALSILSSTSDQKVQSNELGEDIDSLRDREGLQILCQRLKAADSPAGAVFQDILDDWTRLSEELGHDRAYCLFVETGGQTDSRYGRLRLLKGSAELFGRSAATDEITFDNQIKTPDDPFIGSSYNALKSLRELFVTLGDKEKGVRYYHTHFNIVDSGQTFTGDSIGLGAAAVTFAGLMKSEIIRHERLVSQEVAFTGGVDDSGRITAVNEKTLRQKIVRTFFSHIRFLVLPKANLRAAEGVVKELEGQYPRRTLHLIAYERLADVLDDKNVIRSEKVCIGQYVARKAAHVSRMTRLQVPILLALLYVLVSLIYPKAWIGFDRNPKYVHQTETGFVALNADSVALWEKEFGCDVVMSLARQVGDINGDGKNEVAVVPQTNAACSCHVNLFVYEGGGNLLFRGDCSIQGEYPGDTTRFQSYSTRELMFIRHDDTVFILTSLTQDEPSRTHYKFWNPDGALRGWYVVAGSVWCWPKLNARGSCQELLFYGANNRLSSACVFVLPVDTMYGVSPPYSDSDYDLTWVKPGNQLKYIFFPQTDFNRATNWPYNRLQDLKFEGNGSIKANVIEGSDDVRCNVFYHLDSNLRVFAVTHSDVFKDFRADFVDAGKLQPVNDWGEYITNLRDAVSYWTGSGWVTEGELRAAEKSQ